MYDRQPHCFPIVWLSIVFFRYELSWYVRILNKTEMLYSSNLSNNWTATIAFSVFIEFNAVKLKYQQNPVFIPSIFFYRKGFVVDAT